MFSEKKNLIFDYNAFGQRIAKHVRNVQTGMLEKSTYYTLDAQEEKALLLKTTSRQTCAVAWRNQLSMYEHVVQESNVRAYLMDRNIYGSSRLGSNRDTINLLHAHLIPSYGVLGNRNYELNNHLGNVLAVVNDHITPISSDNSTIDTYQVGLDNVYDYSPFGVQLDGRTMEKQYAEIPADTLIYTDSLFLFNSNFENPNVVPHGTSIAVDGWLPNSTAIVSVDNSAGNKRLKIVSSTNAAHGLNRSLATEAGVTYTFKVDIEKVLVDNNVINVLIWANATATGGYTLKVLSSNGPNTFTYTATSPNISIQIRQRGTYFLDNLKMYKTFQDTLITEAIPPRGGYRYGYQGQEFDRETGLVNYTYRMHDPRLGRFFAVDPLAGQYSYNSPYAFSENRVIDGVELEGLEFKKRTSWNDVNKSMYQLRDNPESINQTGAGTCTMAAITYIWIKRDFESFHKAVTGLYFVGHAQVNNFRIEPDANLFWVHPDNSRNSMNAPYDFGATEDLAADWIILSSLQNSLHPDQEFYGYGTGNNSQAGNNRDDLRFMMKNLLGLTNINYKYYDTQPGAREGMNPNQVLSNLEGLKSGGNEIVMSINAKMLDSRVNGNHSVTYLGNYQDLGDGNISFDVQSWGSKMTVTTTTDNFKENYNGASWGK